MTTDDDRNLLEEVEKPSFAFIPGGTQLDDDPINEVATNVGETLSLISQIDTTGLTAPLTFLEFESNLDTNELELEAVNVIDDKVFDITIFDPVVDPDTGLLTQKVTFTAINDGQAPYTVLDRDNIIFRVTGLNNDGVRDLDLVVTSAIDADGNDVTSLFQPPFELEVQNEPSTFNIYNLQWTGDNGYHVDGFFSFDSDLKGSLITENELKDLQLAFYNPSDELIQVFDYDFPNPDTSGEFNFNFDSATDTVLQSGDSDGETGFDLGIDFGAGESGIDFFSGEDDLPIPGLPPGGTIGLSDANPPLSSDQLDRGGELIASLAEPLEVSDI